MTSPNQIILAPGKLLEGDANSQTIKVLITNLRLRQLKRGEQKHIYFGHKEANTSRTRLGTYTLAQDCNEEMSGRSGNDYAMYHVVLLKKVEE
jgi:hypothetical protein